MEVYLSNAQLALHLSMKKAIVTKELNSRLGWDLHGERKLVEFECIAEHWREELTPDLLGQIDGLITLEKCILDDNIDIVEINGMLKYKTKKFDA